MLPPLKTPDTTLTPEQAIMDPMMRMAGSHLGFWFLRLRRQSGSAVTVP